MRQHACERRPAELLKIPARVRFLSVEPLLGPVDLAGKRNWLAQDTDDPNIHWVIVGGESGPNARPCNVDWIRSIKDQCKASNVPVFVKQLGSNPHCECGELPANGLTEMQHPKGGDPEEWPEDLRARQFPEVNRA